MLGSIDAAQTADARLPAPERGTLRLRVRAIALGRAGAPLEAAGEIEAIGDAVTGFDIGDAVSTLPGFQPNDRGIRGERLTLPARTVVKHPRRLSFAEAASIWTMFLTAYGALITLADLAAGETVLLPAASSCIGLAAIQIANAVGAVPVALTRHAAKRERLYEAGAAHVIAIEEEDLVEAVLDLTDGRGARVAFDPVGGPLFPRLIEATAVKGTMIAYGALSDGPTTVPMQTLVTRQPTIHGYAVTAMTSDPALLDEAIAFVSVGLKAGMFTPMIDRVFPVEHMVEARRRLASADRFGKVVVTL
jgi:NADPH:quinone reductase-like Zn-dependent oxidoreductase